ncbi:hypothetical protein MTR67_032296 [Solanum verrucosum]|uniref:Uncharacterized protein n=1 Tax=Solanum verrucosum TaxID=315347 RepID=A0AAF0ZFE1_SOLVR|nr:hypothetical protein MTR67_032296 [Solanum verrucosum]
MSSIGEFACTYACLILHDDDIPINVITPTSNNNVATPPPITDNDASTAPSVNNKKKEEIKKRVMMKPCLAYLIRVTSSAYLKT